MKIKVIHLLRRVERIDRDLEELDRLRATIQEDRDYADRVRDSLTEEARRLGDLRERILTQVVKDPPVLEEGSSVASAVLPVAPVAAPAGAEAAGPQPEIIVPRKGRPQRSSPKKSAAAPDSEKSAGRKKDAAAKSAAPFQFRYN